MRLDLPRHNCIHFAISGEARVAVDKNDAIHSLMFQTVNYTHSSAGDDSEDTLVAIFGSRSRVRGIMYRVRATLSQRVEGSEYIYTISIEYNRASEQLRPPPRRIRPVSILIDNASQLFDIITFDCEGVFEYHQSDGYTSKFQFPLPMIFQDDSRGITHMERAEFSNRSGDDVQYTVSVFPDHEQNFVEHMVGLQRDIQINRNAIRALFGETSMISSRLVHHAGES